METERRPLLVVYYGCKTTFLLHGGMLPNIPSNSLWRVGRGTGQCCASEKAFGSLISSMRWGCLYGYDYSKGEVVYIPRN